jgi:hypothetical protein
VDPGPAGLTSGILSDVPVLIILVVVAVIGVGVYYSWQAKQKRRQALAAFALQHSLQFSAEDVERLDRQYPFPLFNLGNGRGCENVIAGRWQDVGMREADYWYYTETSNGKGGTSRQYHHFSVIVVDLAAFLPDVSIGRENVLTRLADHLGLEDIEFESEQFNRCFNVKAKDREFCFKLIDDRMMAWLLNAGDKLCVEVSGPNALLYCGRLPVERVTNLFYAAKGFVDHIPRLVWNEYGKAAS